MRLDRLRLRRTRLSICARLLIVAAFAAVAAPATLQAASGPVLPGEQLFKFFAGPGVSVPASLGPDVNGMALDAAGKLYVGVPTSGGKSSVAAFDASGNFVRSWAAIGNVLTVGPDGLIYVAPAKYGDGIDVFSTDGTLVRHFGDNIGLVGVRGIAVGPHGDLWVTSLGSSQLGFDQDAVVHLSPTGAVLGHVTPVPQRAAGGTNIITGLALDPDGSLWMTVTAPQELVHYDPSGKQLSAPDPKVLMGQAEGLTGVAIADGRIYVSGGTDELRSSIAAAVFTPAGLLIDTIPGTAALVAADSSHMYLTRYVSSTPLAQGSAVGYYYKVPEFHLGTAWAPGPNGAFGSTTGSCEGDSTPSSTGVDTVMVPNTAACRSSKAAVSFVNDLSKSNPCDKETPSPTRRPDTATLTAVYNGGTRVAATISQSSSGGDSVAFASIPGDKLRGGSVIFRYHCTFPGGGGTDIGNDPAFEFKGDVTLLDPSGNIVDASGHPIAGASVKITFSPTRKGPFVTPPLAGTDPQLPVELTGPTGSFAWDVAPGFWRLRVAAFGYRSFTSRIYHVPPAVTGLRLKLTRDPRQQARLINPAGTVGSLRLGAHATRSLHVAGLALRVAHGRLTKITVRGGQFRTALGISIGSTPAALEAAYPTQGLSALRRHSTNVKVQHATFTLKKGRVSAITLTR